VELDEIVGIKKQIIASPDDFFSDGFLANGCKEGP
jgi:hypothetical protein